MRRGAILMAMLCLPLAFASAGGQEKAGKEMVDNPAYKNWSSFKKGAQVTLKEVATDRSGDDPNAIDATAHPQSATEIYNTFTLLEVTPERAVVRWVQRDIHATHETEHSPKRLIYPAKVDASHAGRSLPKEKVANFKEGEETLECDGTKIPCKWASSDIKAGDELSSSKMWWSADVPGGIVKQVTVKKQGDKVFFETHAELVKMKAEKK
jgi:hypothetical protein